MPRARLHAGRGPRPLVAAIFALLTACASPPKGRRWVDQVQLRGAAQLSASKIIQGMETRPTPWWWWIPLVGQRQWFEPAALDADLRRVERYYAVRGFFSARVAGEQIIPKRGGRAVDVRLQLAEGKPTRTVGVEIRGLERLPRQDRQHVTRDLPLRAGQRFDYEAYRRGKALIRRRLKARGYAYARCEGEVRVDRDNQTARARYSVAAGPLVRMGPVRFAGADPIPTSKLSSAVSWEPGEPYHPDQLARTRARLFRYQVFSTVKVKLPEQPTELAPVTIEVSPTKLRELRLGGGIGLEPRWQEVHLFGRWTWRNFLGGLRELETRLRPKVVAIPTAWAAERSGFAGQAEVQLTQPDLLGSGITAFGLFGYELGLQEGYRYHGPRLQFGGDRSLLRDLLRLGLSWNFQYLSFYDVTSFDAFDNPLGPGVDGSTPYRLAWLEPFVHVDWRDDIIDPRVGLFGELRLEFGLPQVGGRFTYVKVTPDLRGYVPLGSKRLVLALRALFSQLIPIEDQQAGGAEAVSPVTRRTWFGGANNHRAFGYRRLSPQVFETRQATSDSGVSETVETGRLIPVGGDSALLLAADLRLRAFELFGNWLQVIAFFDAGDVASSFDQLAQDGLYLGVGGGLQYQTPIGSLGAALGFRLNRQRDQRTATNRPVDADPNDPFAFHLTLGGAF